MELRKTYMAYTITNNTRVHTRSSVAVSEVGLFERHLLEVTRETADEHSGRSPRDFLE